jgi:hypothetical protein
VPFVLKSRTTDNNNNKDATTIKLAQPRGRGLPITKFHMKIMPTLATYIWSKDNLIKVIIALAFLVGAKVNHYYSTYFFHSLPTSSIFL